ncbi:MAG TPA: adenosine deaminase [Terriglobales bacterium]|jgi:adenosine deaminase/aminodeoxyfutalosine deaminase|nr:adenosine deaminase [Terriglobales bacterium]
MPGDRTLVKDASELTPSPFILALPKAELHLHLEGAVEPATLLELSQRHGGRLHPADVEALYRYSDFPGFLAAFKTVTDYLRTPEDYELITWRLMERLKSENVVHAEVYISVGVVQWRGLDFDPIFEGLERGRARGEKEFGVSLLWIFDAVRHFGPEAAEHVLDQAIRHRQRHVAGIGIGGDEQRAAPEVFREVYARAREAGLRRTAHAGESAGPESVLGALDALGAERIGHALNAWHDRELVARLGRQQVPLELCPTSNLRTGCCKALEQHPLRQYFDQGLLVTLNSDDPAMFQTSLAREYALAQQAFGFRDEELRTLARNSFQASFLPEAQKQNFLARIA